MSLKTNFTRVARLVIAASALLIVPAAAKDVATFADLCAMADDPKGDYALVRDINVTAEDIRNLRPEGFRPIGTEKAPFTGKFRGQGHVIRGLYINRPREGHVGLFGYVGKGAEISNVGVVADTVIGNYSVGVLAGTNKGLIESCYSAGVVVAGVGAQSQRESSAGGLVGFNGGTIDRSYSAASVSGKQYVGGLTGFLTVDADGFISESYATGEVTGNENYVGGLVGYIFDGRIEKCFSTGKVVGAGDRVTVGGLVGGDFGSSNTSWNVRGKNGTGGYIKNAEIKNSFWDKNTSGVDHSVGGEGKTSEEMKDPQTFKDWGGFDTTWNLADGAGYPLSRSAPLCTLTYRAGINGKLTIGGVVLPQDSVFTVVLQEGSKTPEIRAVADDTVRYEFKTWTGTDTVKSPNRIDAASSQGAAVNVTALFLLKGDVKTCKLTYMVEKGHESWGSLRIDATGGVMQSSQYSMIVPHGVTGFVVTAVPAYGCSFVGWWVPDSTRVELDSVRSDVATDSITFTAIFSGPPAPEPVYTLIYSSYNGGLLRKNGNAVVSAYYPDTLKANSLGPVVAAVPNSGFRFEKWSDGVTTLARQDKAERNATFAALFQNVTTDAKEIYDAGDLQNIGNDPAFPLDGNYILMKEIYLNDEEFTPIGSYDKPFTGIFDGNMKEIVGLKITRSDGNFTGLFGYAKNAQIRRVVLKVAEVKGGGHTGALVGRCVNTVIDSCRVEGEVVSGANGVGGLVGSAGSSLIIRSFSMAKVEGKVGVGGLVGAADSSMVTHCYAEDDRTEADFIVDGDTAVGGLIGKAGGGVAQYSYAVINTHGKSAAGGFVGEASRAAEFYQCYSAGKVVKTGEGSVGGFVGAADTVVDKSVARSCFWDIDVNVSGLKSALGIGIGQVSMMFSITYNDDGDGWDFKSVWDVKTDGTDYPYLRELQPDPLMKSKRATSARQADKRLIRVRGRVMTVNAPHGAAWQVRLIDMRGRTVAKYNTQNAARITLNRIPSGRYMVETRNRGKRVDVSAIVLK